MLSFLKKMSSCQDNPETKINENKPSGYSLFTHCSFDTTENKIDNYSGKNCMKSFCLNLREHATKMIN